MRSSDSLATIRRHISKEREGKRKGLHGKEKQRKEKGKKEKWGNTLFFLGWSIRPSWVFIQPCWSGIESKVQVQNAVGATSTKGSSNLLQHVRCDVRLTAAEAIAWTRIARPGSVLGHQQQFLVDKQQVMWSQGDAHRRQLTTTTAPANRTTSND